MIESLKTGSDVVRTDKLKDHVNASEFQIAELLGKGKSGHSYLAFHHENPVVMKKMHQEEVSYYTFSKPKVTLELEAYQLLKETAILIPELLGYNHEEQFIVKQFIPGQVVSEILCNGPLPEMLLITLLEWEEQLRQQQINIDYFPTNFVIDNDELYYVDYEHNAYSDEYNFRNWGIYYWLNHEGFAAFVATGDSSFINIPGTGKPIVDLKLMNQRDELIARFNALKNSNTIDQSYEPTTTNQTAPE